MVLLNSLIFVILGVDEEVLGGYFPMFNNFQQNPSFNNYIPYNSYTANLAQQNANFNNQSFQAQTNITFVNGMEGAKAFQLRPNSNVLLMDSDNSKFYVKSTDNLGIANIQTYSFVEDKNLPVENVAASQPSDAGEQNTKLYDEMKNKINELETKVDELQSKLNEVL